MKLWDRLTGKAQAEAVADLEQKHKLEISLLKDQHANEISQLVWLAAEYGVLLYKEREMICVPEFDDPYVRYVPGAWKWAAKTKAEHEIENYPWY